jgi:Phage tail tube protein, GTA-gp10
MTNPHKGDVELWAGGNKYTIRYTHGALVKLENQLGKGLFRVMQEMIEPENMRIGTVVAMLWAGLQKHHPTMTIEEATDLLDEIEGGARGTVEILGEAFQRAFSAPGTKGTHPIQPKAENGTGMPGSSISSVSATTSTPSGSLRTER